MSLKKTTLSLSLGALLGLGLPLLPGVGAAASVEQAPAQQAMPYLGVGIESLPPALVAQLPESASRDQGVLVRQVEPGSPADQAGIRPFDVLLSYDDQKLYSPEQLTKLVRSDQVGRTAKLSVLRRGKVMEVEVKLGGREAPMAHHPMPRPEPRWQHRRHPMPFGPAMGQDRGVWQEFEALSLTSQGNGRYKAAVDYLDAKGQKQHLEFEGTRDEIRKEIQGRDDLPVELRQQLLEALDLDRNPWGMFPRLRGFDFPAMPRWGRDWPTF